MFFFIYRSFRICWLKILYMKKPLYEFIENWCLHCGGKVPKKICQRKDLSPIRFPFCKKKKNPYSCKRKISMTVSWQGGRRTKFKLCQWMFKKWTSKTIFWLIYTLFLHLRNLWATRTVVVFFFKINTYNEFHFHKILFL